MAIIETESLTKYYGPCRGIEDLNLRIDEGEVFGFLGPNGAGKTTTIRLLLGLIRPTSGRFGINGTLIASGSSAYRKDIAYLPGEVGLYGHLTGRQFLARIASLRSTTLAYRIDDLARRLNLELSQKIRSLSHGTRQKLAIVQAFMHDVRLLILDEPTNGLDPLVQQVFYELVQEALRRGATIFLSSHVLSEVERICSRVGMVREGRLVLVEEIESLKKKRVKHVEVELAKDMATKTIHIKGVGNVQVEGHAMRFTVKSGYREVLQALAAYPIENITIQDATLEDIFLEHYAISGEETP